MSPIEYKIQALNVYVKRNKTILNGMGPTSLTHGYREYIGRLVAQLYFDRWKLMRGIES